MLHAAYLACLVTALFAGLVPTTVHGADASNALPVTVHCPAIRTPKGTLVARYVQDYFPSGADACVAISGADQEDPRLLQVVPFNFCPRGGQYAPRRNATDVCLNAFEPEGHRPARTESAAKG